MAAVCTRHRAMGRTTARAAAEPTVPFTWSGIGYGEEGEGYVRIAMVENEQRIRQAARSLKRFLDRHHNVMPLRANG